MTIYLLFLSAITWSLFDLIRKKTLKYLNIYELTFVIIVAQLFFFIISLSRSGMNISGSLYFLYSLPLILLNIFSMLLFLKLLKQADISLVIPMLSFTPLFSSIYSNLVLGEVLNTLNYIGIVSTTFGALILFSKSLKLKDILYCPMSITKNRHVYFMLLVALIWSLTPVLDKKCLEFTDVYFHGFFQAAGSILILPFLLKNSFKKKITYNKSFVYLIFCIALVSFFATYFQLIAIKTNMVAVLEAVKRSTGIIMSLFYGYYFFKEPVNQQKIFGVLIILVGINFILGNE
tara:strand:+ start:1940 stop:2809 length:870 start_codon:yes stop_codon:yes gene_type:complete